MAAPLLVLAAFACQKAAEPAPDPPKLETVDVGAARDATLSTAGDAQEKRHEAAFAGVLPTGFPKDLPVYEPSTLIDFGGGPQGSYALFQTPDDVARVRARYPATLRSRGWSAAGDAYAKGTHHVRMAIESAHPGARIRIEY